MMKPFLLATALLFSGIAFSQELKLPVLSPAAKFSQDFSTSSIDVSYSRPSMRGRKVFGDVVPYGEMWRTGANAATKIKFGEDVMVGDKPVKAGEYALYTIPGKESWQIILNKGITNWGTSGYTQDDDVVRISVTPQMLDKNVQSFTMLISNITFSTCKLELLWEKTRVVVPIKADNETRLNASIDKAINNPSVPYYQAAGYYFETGKNLDKAYEYVNKGIEQNPKAYYMYYMKARIAAKLGKKTESIAAAKKSIELSAETANAMEYKTNNERIIKEMSR